MTDVPHCCYLVDECWLGVPPLRGAHAAHTCYDGLRVPCTLNATHRKGFQQPFLVFDAVRRVVGPRRVSSRGLFCAVSSIIDGSRLERLSGLLSYRTNRFPKAVTKLKDIRLISCDLHKPFTPNNANWLNEFWFVNMRAMFKMLHIWERAF